MPADAFDDFEPIDLLNPTPMLRLDPIAARRALSFAFATGAAGDVFEQMLDQAPLPRSEWDPDDFAADVFLDELVDGCLGVFIHGHRYETRKTLLTRLLAQPSPEPEAVCFRQAILRELVDEPVLRSAIERLYRKGIALRELLCRRDAINAHDATRRRIDIMAAVRELAELLAEGFAPARSGLHRLCTLGTRIQGRDSYSRLCQLLEQEHKRAEVDLRLHVGADGTVRSCTALAVREDRTNPYHQSRLWRLCTRLIWLLRGMRIDETDLLGRHFDGIMTGLENDLLCILQLLGDLEFYLGGLNLRDRAKEAGLQVCLPTFGEEGRALEGLFNPLLLCSGSRIVPCDMRGRQRGATTIVTGPNSGGKTRLLQAIALTQILAQAGLFVPGHRARLPWARGLFVSVIEHARADQQEGRLGTELLRIRRLFASTRKGSLVILDELCSGTNPSEGEDIFRLVLQLLPMLQPDAFITTHFLGFAKALRREGGGQTFLQVELDANEDPTFRFVEGVATTSLAQRTAQRLGVTAQSLMALIRRNNPEAPPPTLAAETAANAA